MNLIPLTIESLVAILLLLTILYCVRLNGQLKRLRADETVMKQVIADLTVASDRAERSVAILKTTVAEADHDLGERLRMAERFCADIASQTEVGNEVLNRLARIVNARAATTAAPTAPPVPPAPPARQPAAPTAPNARQPAAPAAPNAHDIAALAQAFADRAQARLKSRAA